MQTMEANHVKNYCLYFHRNPLQLFPHISRARANTITVNSTLNLSPEKCRSRRARGENKQTTARSGQLSPWLLLLQCGSVVYASARPLIRPWENKKIRALERLMPAAREPPNQDAKVAGLALANQGKSV